jgi:hypothetical protein
VAEDEAPKPPPPQVVLIPTGENWIYITDGGENLSYRVTNGEVTVDPAHVAAILGAVPGSSLKPEAPAPKTKPKPGEEK